MQRILKTGGKLYRYASLIRVCNNKVTQETEIYYATNHQDFLQIDRIPEESEDRLFGPWRVKPGGLSVDTSYIRCREHLEISKVRINTTEV